MVISNPVLLNQDWDLSRHNEIFVIFCGFLNFFLDLNREIVYFYKYLDRDFSSQPFLFTFCASKLASKWAKSVGNSNFFQKVSTKILFISKKHGYLDLSRWSQLVLTILIKISTQPSLDWKVSILKVSTKEKIFWSWRDG